MNRLLRRLINGRGRQSGERRAIGYVVVADALDFKIAALLAVVVGVLLTVWAYPALHPDFWGVAAVATGARPPETPIMGLWSWSARMLCRALGVESGLTVLSIAGHVVGGLLAGIAYLLIRVLLSTRLALQPAEVARCAFTLRILAAVGTLAFACADPVWRMMQFLTPDLFQVMLAALAMCAFGAFLRVRRLSWYCLGYVFSGMLTAESPIGLFLTILFFLGNELSKFQGRPDTSGYYMDRDDSPVSYGDSPVGYSSAYGDPDEAASSEEMRAETSLENWAFCVFFLMALIGTLLADAWLFNVTGGLDVKKLGAMDYPMLLSSAWAGQIRGLISMDDLVAVVTLSVLPFVFVRILMPTATNSNSSLAFPLGWLVFFMGVVAYTQLGPFRRLWYWSWDLSRTTAPSGTVQTVLAFFGAGTVAAALQVIYCGCRRRVASVERVAITNTAAHARLRTFGGFVLCCLTLVLLAGSLAGRADSCLRRHLALMRDYARLVADDAKGLRRIFTDGVFDDLHAVELWGRGDFVFPISVLSGRAPYERYLRMRVAKDVEDVPVLEEGGSDALRFWVAEKPQHIRESALQIGFEQLKKCRHAVPRTAGMVLRVASTAVETNACVKADAAAAAFARRVLDETSRRGRLGGLDGSAAAKVDALLWRLARLADQRALAAAEVADAEPMRTERALSRALDEANGSVKILQRRLERLRPAESRVLTPREGLDISLRRADFDLARRYAEMVRRVDVDDAAANFAMGMWEMQGRDFRRAAYYLEVALKRRPDDLALLNNAAISRLKVNDLDAALLHAEHAAKLYPNSKEVKINLSKIKEAISAKAEKQEKK